MKPSTASLVLASVLLSPPTSLVAQAPEPEASPPPAAVGPLLEPFVHDLTVTDGALAGPGAAMLREEAQRARFFLLGEQHATAEIAELAAALYRTVAPHGYGHAAIEVGPVAARRLETLLRDDDPEALAGYFAEGTSLFTIPFFFFREEAAFARVVVEQSPAPSPVLWGIDQEFIAGAPLVLDRLADLATSEEERTAVAAAREAVAANPMFLGAAADGEIAALTAAFAGAESPEARDLAEQVLATHRIYAPFTGRGGGVWAANHERERLMKRLFLRHYREVRERDGQVPRVFVKLGANHLFRGLSPTHVLSLGTFLYELAVAEGVEAYTLHVDCRGGEAMDIQAGGPAPCASYFLGPDSVLTGALPADRTVLVDLRALRNEHEILELFDDTSRDLVWSFDGYVSIPDTRPATLFEGTPPDLGN